MTSSTTIHRKVPFTISDENAFDLLGGFRWAALRVGWSEVAVMQTVNEAMAGNYAHLQATLAAYCLPEQKNREPK